eukprot:1161200-Pelagomonas_calceolata.AAC.5
MVQEERARKQVEAAERPGLGRDGVCAAAVAVADSDATTHLAAAAAAAVGDSGAIAHAAAGTDAGAEGLARPQRQRTGK